MKHDIIILIICLCTTHIHAIDIPLPSFLYYTSEKSYCIEINTEQTCNITLFATTLYGIKHIVSNIDNLANSTTLTKEEYTEELNALLQENKWTIGRWLIVLAISLYKITTAQKKIPLNIIEARKKAR